jgi:hypothetical protein
MQHVPLVSGRIPKLEWSARALRCPRVLLPSARVGAGLRDTSAVKRWERKNQE